MKVIGHRGAAGSAPENTLISFLKGLEYKVDGFEFDVQLSRDGEVVVCHDERVDRTSNGMGWIKDFTLQELKRLDFGSWFTQLSVYQEIPTLRELLDMFKTFNLELNVEIKSGLVQYPEIGEKVVNLLAEYGLLDNSIISSFDHQLLLDLKQHFPRVKTGILYDCAPIKPWLYAKFLNAQYLHPAWHFVSSELVVSSAVFGIGINTWTVNSSFAAHKVRTAHVARIITDYPQCFRKGANGEAIWLGL
ncbi:Glycerophosphoryl diester phosphodiesterase [Candidatus Desulfosporosinus infrequens]|uniref:Glycerophosphoryl diester phosphodiesterase n=1 Tax=Candidatus Desulfosporosinus infrequens TaxID=2043169 RepID=A0A2U3LFJ3_9FIRM|nr:Glycerophosphoryl diester phosphodiesterase [Candidatus Desulfosporosinus infrequens]